MAQALEMIGESRKQIERMDVFVETMRKMSSLDARELVAEEITSKQLEIDIRAELNVFEKKIWKAMRIRMFGNSRKIFRR